MEVIRNFPLFTIILSLFSGALCILLPGRTARKSALAVEGVLLLMAAAVLAGVLHAGEAFTYTMGEFPAPWGNEIRAGVLEALLAVSFLGILFCSVLAGHTFLEEDLDVSRIPLYYTLIHLLTAAMMSLIWTNDIFTGYVFLEIMTLTSCGILIVREIGRTTLAAVRYMILNLVGSGLFLLGVVLLYDLTGHLLMVPMRETIAVIAGNPASMRVLNMAVGILTIGLAIKSGLFPFHTWMPDTYGWATPTSASVLAALVSKTYIFLLVKIYFRAVGIPVLEQMHIRNVLFALGILGMIVGSVLAIRADNINRMVAYSSAAQIGYIYMGIGLGGPAGYVAALFHMLVHAVTKSQLFLTTPHLARVSGKSLKFKKLQGSGIRNVEAGIFFTFSALSMIGIPVFAGFASKLQFGLAAVRSGSSIRLVAVIIALALSSVLNASYFIRTIIRIYSAEDHAKRAHLVRKDRLPYMLPMLILAAFNLFLGLLSWVVIGWIEQGLAMFV